jgi:hypothetical protein
MAGPKLCSIPGCSKPLAARGWCQTHYSRWHTNGSPHVLKPRSTHRRADLAGTRFGRLVAISFAASTSQGAKWLCRCDCGETTYALAKKLNLGTIKSCGCAQYAPVHGATIGGRRSPEYQSWQAMKSRCYNSRNVMFHRYGKRGITVCDQWRENFEQFVADMGPRPKGHSLDRINNDGDYEPGNCRWSPKLEQDNNRSTCMTITLGGLTGSLSDVYRKISPRPAVSIKTAWQRISKGIRPEDAFYIPSRDPRIRDMLIALRC